MHPALKALLICLVAAAFEGALAGRGVRARFAELRMPAFSPPLTVWFLIGGGYYVICFIILYRLLAAGLPTFFHWLAVALLLGLMVVNAAWGWFFFRRKDLRASFLVCLPYAPMALGLSVLLLRVDRASLAVLVPYLVYLVYALWWSRQLWMLSRFSLGP